MNKIFYSLIFIIAASTIFASCSETETYAEQRDRELNAISSYIAKNKIKVIDEKTFIAQGETTDTAKNEYVLFESNGVYMQIRSKGKGMGGIQKDGEVANVLCRFIEYNVNLDTIQSSNDGLNIFATAPDKMTVKNTSGTYTATFFPGFMSTQYSSRTVPAGWLYPLGYVNLVRPSGADSELAHVRIIVPHDQGHALSQSNVYACAYDLTYERGN